MANNFKKNQLIKSSKNCMKVDDLFKINIQSKQAKNVLEDNILESANDEMKLLLDLQRVSLSESQHVAAAAPLAPISTVQVNSFLNGTFLLNNQL